MTEKYIRKVQGVSQSQAAANSRHQEKEKKDTNQRVQNKQTNLREAHRPGLSSPSEVITTLKGLGKKHENKEQGKTQHETPRSKNHKATHSKNNTRTTALEGSVE